jgi:hypothetical protein
VDQLTLGVQAAEQSVSELFVALQTCLFDCVPLPNELKKAAVLHDAYVKQMVSEIIAIKKASNLAASVRTRATCRNIPLGPAQKCIQWNIVADTACNSPPPVNTYCSLSLLSLPYSL